MNTTTQDIAVPICPELVDLLAQLSTRTGMPPGNIISKLLGAHVYELHQYAKYLEQLPRRPASARDMAPWFLHNYGPCGLVADIERCDPTYEFHER